jgi:hypothetical protein
MGLRGTPGSKRAVCKNMTRPPTANLQVLLAELDGVVADAQGRLATRRNVIFLQAALLYTK